MSRSSEYHLGASSSSPPPFRQFGEFSEEEECDVIAKKKKKATIEQQQQKGMVCVESLNAPSQSHNHFGILICSQIGTYWIYPDGCWVGYVYMYNTLTVSQCSSSLSGGAHLFNDLQLYPEVIRDLQRSNWFWFSGANQLINDLQSLTHLGWFCCLGNRNPVATRNPNRPTRSMIWPSTPLTSRGIRTGTVSLSDPDAEPSSDFEPDRIRI